MYFSVKVFGSVPRITKEKNKQKEKNERIYLPPQVGVRMSEALWLPPFPTLPGCSLQSPHAPTLPTSRPTGHLLGVAQLGPAALLLLLQGTLLRAEVRAERLIRHGIVALGIVVGIGGHLALAANCRHKEQSCVQAAPRLPPWSRVLGTDRVPHQFKAFGRVCLTPAPSL